MNIKLHLFALMVAVIGLLFPNFAISATIDYLSLDKTIAAYNGNVYQFVGTQNSWEQALTASKASEYNGVTGHLVTITSLEEHQFLWNAFEPLIRIGTGTPWIALTDREEEGIWRWADGPEKGQVASFQLWTPGEPNNLNNGLEDYALMHWFNRGGVPGAWYDYSNGGVQGGIAYIAEFESAAAAVPIPAAFPLLLTGFAALGIVRYRRRKT